MNTVWNAGWGPGPGVGLPHSGSPLGGVQYVRDPNQDHPAVEEVQRLQQRIARGESQLQDLNRRLEASTQQLLAMGGARHGVERLAQVNECQEEGVLLELPAAGHKLAQREGGIPSSSYFYFLLF